MALIKGTRLKNNRLNDLLNVYEDLSETLKNLKRLYQKQAASGNAIDLKKLIDQLNKSKRRMERKIGNTLLLEKQNFKKRIGKIRDSIPL